MSFSLGIHRLGHGSWSFGHVNVSALPGKLVEFADDTYLHWLRRRLASEKLSHLEGSVESLLIRWWGGVRMSVFSTEGEKSDLGQQCCEGLSAKLP